MWVAELQCVHGHTFEGWFGSRSDFESQQARGLVTCPQCGSAEVGRRLSAPRINLGAPKDPTAPADTAPAREASRPDALLRELVAHLKSHAEDVGPRFAEEARRIHAEEAPERAIRGQATPQERQALRDEGIEVWALPDFERAGSSH